MRTSYITAAVIAAIGWLAFHGSAARAAFVVNITQSGSDVVATGSGTINTTSLHDTGSISPFEDLINPSSAAIILGNLSTARDDWERNINGPPSMGSGSSNSVASSYSGDPVGIAGSTDIYLPNGYVSGAALSDSATFTNTSFSSMGITVGTYTWTWGTGVNADSFTINVGTPEPGAIALFGVMGTMLLIRKRRSAATPNAPAASPC